MRPEPAPASSAPGRGSAGGSALGGRGVGPWDPPPSQELGTGAVSARWSPEVLGSVSETKWLSRPNQVLVQPPGSVSNFEGGLKEQSLGFKSHLPSGKTYLRNSPRRHRMVPESAPGSLSQIRSQKQRPGGVGSGFTDERGDSGPWWGGQGRVSGAAPFPQVTGAAGIQRCQRGPAPPGRGYVGTQVPVRVAHRAHPTVTGDGRLPRRASGR